VAKRLLFPLLIALKLRDEEFYKKIISGASNATEIIERLVREHNAWELFDLDPETKKRMNKLTKAYDLCYELYAISHQAWRSEVQHNM
jgi:hypothetical protein